MAQQFDPNDFYGNKPVAPAAPATRSTFGQMPTSGFGAPPVQQYVPVKTKIPTWAKVLIGLGIAGAGLVILGIIAAVAIPVFLSERAHATDAQVQADLTAVATAQETVRATTGSYTGDPLALGIAEPASDIAIVAADGLGYCLAGRAHGDEEATVWFYSPAGGLSRTPCA